jgi:hypothetical protein
MSNQKLLPPLLVFSPTALLTMVLFPKQKLPVIAPEMGEKDRLLFISPKRQQFTDAFGSPSLP